MSIDFFRKKRRDENSSTKRRRTTKTNIEKKHANPVTTVLGNFLGVIYKAVNKTNGKCYVGQTTNFKHRLTTHKHALSKRKTAFYSAIKKYGWDNFEWFEIDFADTAEELDIKEKFWIQELNCLSPNGYNLKNGGRCGGVPLSGSDSPNYKKFDMKKIKHLYLDKKKSCTQIAKLFNTTGKVISNRLKKCNVDVMHQQVKRKNIDDEKIIRMYVEDKMTLEQIGKNIKASPNTIRGRLRKHNVKMRPAAKTKVISNEEDIKTLYIDKKMTTKQIANATNYNLSTVSRLIAQKNWYELKKT